MKDTTKDREAIYQALADGKPAAALAHRVIGLQTHDKLLLSASLLLLNQVNLAQTIAERAIQEMQLVILFAEKEKAGDRT